MVEVNMRCRNAQFVMIVLLVGEALRKFAGIVVEDITQSGDAGRTSGRRVATAGRVAQHFADRLRPALISALLDQRIYRFQKIVVDGDCYAVHFAHPILAC